MLNNKPNVKALRHSFFDACFEYCDALRVRQGINQDELPQKAITIHKELIPVRDVLVDWVLLEGAYDYEGLNDSLLRVVEALFEMKARPKEVTSWRDDDFAAHKVFAYETFLYIVAALIKVENFKAINIMCNASYLLSETERGHGYQFGHFSDIYYFSELFQKTLAPEGRKLNAPVAELIKINSSREDVILRDLIQADLVSFLTALISEYNYYWYPQLNFYASFNSEFPLFLRAAQKRNFYKIAELTGINDPDMLKQKVLESLSSSNINQGRGYGFFRTFDEKFNVKKWATIN